ncbi:protein E12 [Elephant endotheliotropic herpesvirus 5B]|uniref:Membrane protein EE37 n=1 Tax=Elephant endotheliotropic herpesvirus 5 TaxID=768738 RepID=A0A075CYC9_9BETA|nr:membrane protein EE37 [Elephant endotheliotropic herpesvirus 5]AHC02800.1 membrane protein EE37 [Elephant endotheliotropic herpesvirus 5]UVZ35197.1 protein E12 [Elephant endotheliotropic herpesvirus 5B]
MEAYAGPFMAIPIFLLLSSLLCVIFRRNCSIQLIDPVMVMVLSYIGTRMLIRKKAEYPGVQFHFFEHMFLNSLLLSYFILVGIFSIIYSFFIVQQWRERQVDMHVHLIVTMFSRRVLPFLNLVLHNMDLKNFMGGMTDDHTVMARLSYTFLYIGLILVVSEVCDNLVDFPPRFSWFWMFLACGMLCFHQRHLTITTKTSFNANIFSFSFIIYVISKLLYEFTCIIRFH